MGALTSWASQGCSFSGWSGALSVPTFLEECLEHGDTSVEQTHLIRMPGARLLLRPHLLVNLLFRILPGHLAVHRAGPDTWRWCVPYVEVARSMCGGSMFHVWRWCVLCVEMACSMPGGGVFHMWRICVPCMQMACSICGGGLFHTWRSYVLYVEVVCSMRGGGMFHTWACMQSSAQFTQRLRCIPCWLAHPDKAVKTRPWIYQEGGSPGCGTDPSGLGLSILPTFVRQQTGLLWERWKHGLAATVSSNNLIPSHLLENTLL